MTGDIYSHCGQCGGKVPFVENDDVFVFHPSCLGRYYRQAKADGWDAGAGAVIDEVGYNPVPGNPYRKGAE